MRSNAPHRHNPQPHHEQGATVRIDYLRYFKRLAEVGNYTKASQDLFIAQPTLSLAIKRMEEQLGFPLFDRTKNGIRLTESGQVFYEFASRCIDDYETGVRLAQEKQGQISTNLRLGTIYAMQGKFFSRALDDFGRQCAPDLKITLKQGFSRELIPMLKRGDIDVAFCSKIEGTTGLVFNECWSQPLVIGVNKSPLARRKGISLRELKDKEILTYVPQSPPSPEIEKVVEEYGLHVYQGYDDEVALSSLVSRNEESIALFCYSFLVNAFEDVACIPVWDVPVDFHKTYVVSRNESHPQIVSDFIAFMSEYHFPNILDEKE